MVDPDDDGPGEVPASTGGVVDLDRVIGTIPVLLVFVEPLIAPEVDRLVEDLGLHLADFGRRLSARRQSAGTRLPVPQSGHGRHV